MHSATVLPHQSPLRRPAGSTTWLGRNLCVYKSTGIKEQHLQMGCSQRSLTSDVPGRTARKEALWVFWKTDQLKQTHDTRKDAIKMQQRVRWGENGMPEWKLPCSNPRAGSAQSCSSWDCPERHLALRVGIEACGRREPVSAERFVTSSSFSGVVKFPAIEWVRQGTV